MSRLPLVCTAIAASSAALALSGCTAPAEPVAAQPTIEVQTPRDLDAPASPLPGDAGDTAGPVSPAPPAPSAPSSGQPTPASTPSVAAEQPFAVRPGAVRRVRVHAAIFPVRRSGQTATANVMISADDPFNDVDLEERLSDRNPEVGSRSPRSVDGLRLIDGKNKKTYLPATTADGVCACTPADGGMWNKTNVVWVSVVFAAPPADLTTIDVQIPLFGTVTNVPLS